MTKKQLRVMGKKMKEVVILWNWKFTSNNFGITVIHPYEYEGVALGQTCSIQINDSPDEPPYTLFINGERAGNLEEWPKRWVHPSDFASIC